MLIEWSFWAIQDREQIFSWIELDDPLAALRIDEAVQSQVERLADFPESGRPGRVSGTRELLVVQTPYLVVYGFDGFRIRILRVLHGALRWPEDFPDQAR